MAGMKSFAFSLCPDESSPSLRALTGLMIVLTLVGAFWAALYPIRGSNDCWWHVKTGEYLWSYFQDNGFHLPPYDVFTYTGDQTPWVNHEWLSTLLIYAFYQLGGLQGAIVFKSVVFTLTIALLMLYMHRNGVGWKMACLGSLLTLFACQTSLDLRPPVFSYLFVVIFLHLILSLQLDEYFWWSFAAAVAGEMLWINLHGGAVIGLLLFFFWWLSELWFCLITWMRENPTAPSFRRLIRASLMLAAVILASLINPWGYEVHLLPFKVTGDWWLVEHIGELQPPNFHYTTEFELIVLGLFMLPMLRAGSIWVYEGLAVIFFGHQALNYMRHIPLFALVAVPPLMSALAEERRALIPTDRGGAVLTGFWGRLCGMIKWGLNRHVDVIVVFVAVAYLFGLRPYKIWDRNSRDFPALRQDGYVRDRYPVDAANFILRYLKGPMFNHDNFAGYLIFRMSPEVMKIFTDSRYDLWGSRYAKEELAVFYLREIPLGAYDEKGEWWDFKDMKTRADIQAGVLSGKFPEIRDWFQGNKPYWQYVLDQYQVNFVITWKEIIFDQTLRENFMGWYLVFDNNTGYVIYLRDTPENRPIIEKFAITHRERLGEKAGGG